MARPVKSGLSYFPFDVDFFQDDKIELISSEFGIRGELITIRLLCLIYKNGYYYKWGPDESLLFAKRVGNGVSGSLVNEVIAGLVKRSFFDKRVFDSFSVLTSRDIQTCYLEAKSRSKQADFISDFALIPINAAITPVNVYNNAQSKGKENQVKESKGGDKACPPQVILNKDFFSSSAGGVSNKGSPRLRPAPPKPRN